MPGEADRQVRISHAGKTYKATWRVEDGEVVVVSAYGSARREQPPRGKSDCVAELLLKELVIHWGPWASQVTLPSESATSWNSQP